MRKYNIDAHRNMGDLKLKVLANWEYNNLLLTCYDTALLWLADIYFKAPSGNYAKLEEVNLITLVKVLQTRKAWLDVTLKGYDRLYFIYELVYRNYFSATKTDVIEAIKTLEKITHYWCAECEWASLVELVTHICPEKAKLVSELQSNDINRKELVSMLGFEGALENTWRLLEATDE